MSMYAIQYGNTNQYVTTDPQWIAAGPYEFTSDKRAIDKFETREAAIEAANSLGVSACYVVEIVEL